MTNQISLNIIVQQPYRQQVDSIYYKETIVQLGIVFIARYVI